MLKSLRTLRTALAAVGGPRVVVALAAIGWGLTTLSAAAEVKGQVLEDLDQAIEIRERDLAALSRDVVEAEQGPAQ